MAESHTYRVQFWVRSTIFIAILVGILVVLAFVGDRFSRYKADLTNDGLYTISEHFVEILQNLNDRVTVTYYVSENMPSMLLNLRRDTVDMLEEIKAISGGKVDYKVVDLEAEARKFARQKVEEYKEAKEKGETPDEPEPRQTIQDLFSGRQQPKKKPEEIAEARRKQAATLAERSGRDVDDAFYDLLEVEWKENFLDEQEEEGLRPYTFQERRGTDIQTVSFFSALEVSYKDKEPEIMPLYYQVQTLELELATRILRLTNEKKSVVAFFDARAPETPPVNPMNPQQGPQSDYQGITGHLSQLFDVRTIRLKEGDTLDDLRVSLADEAKRAAEEEGGEPEPAEISCFIVAQPHELEERQIYEISRAVSEGIPTILLVSRHSIDVDAGMRGRYPIEFLYPGLDDYFASLGFRLGSDVLGSNSCSALPAMVNVGGGLALPTAFPFAVTVMATAMDNLLNEEAALTNGIPHLVFPATNGITLLPDKIKQLGLEIEKLAWTFDETWAVQVLPFSSSPFGRGQPPNLLQYQADLIERKMPPERHQAEFIERKELAFMLSGEFPFFYQDKDIPEWKKEPVDEGDDDDVGGGEGSGGPLGQAGAEGPGAETGPAPAPEGETPAPEGETPAPEGETPAETAPASGQPAGDDVATEPSEGKAGAEGSAESAEGEDSALTDLEMKGDVTPRPGRLVVYASADALKDRYFRLGQQYSDYQANVQFLSNALEAFGLGEDGEHLLKMRKKHVTQRNFEDATEDKQAYIQVINFAVLPALVGIFGLVRFLFRRAEANAYERQRQSPAPKS